MAPLPTTGFGFLGMTWRDPATPDEQAFAAMKAAVDNGATLWSTASYYGMPPNPPTASLHLMRRYFERYPEDAEKVTLFVRGCVNPTLMPTVKKDEVRSSFEECQEVLGSSKRINVFGPARMNKKNVPVEETMGALKELIDEGKIDAAGLSEVAADTIIKAHAVCPVGFVELEFSLWSTEMLTNGAAAACKERDIAIMAYAPLGYGFLTGQVTKLEDIPQGDPRHKLGRFQPETFYKNLDLVDKVKGVAAQKGVTPAQLALAWIRAQSKDFGGELGTVIPIPGVTRPEKVPENCEVVEMTKEEVEGLNEVLKDVVVVGSRQVPGKEHITLWT